MGRPLQLLLPERSDSQQLQERRYSKGIYYTPPVLVDYLVQRTLDDVTSPPDALQSGVFRILDPSCGCGAFLIGALTYLLGDRSVGARSARADATAALPAQARLDLLASSLYGFDIDKRATSIAMCLLLVTVWRSCTADGILLDGRSEVRIPDIASNLMCADFLDSRTGLALMRMGGVDVVLGGPPFVRIEQLFRTQRSKIPQYRRHFQTAQSGQFDLYMLFIEKALRLLSERGQLAMSVSSSFLRSASGRALRNLIARQCHVREVVQFTCNRVYPDASVQVALLHLQKSPLPEPTRYVLLDQPEALSLSLTTMASGRQSSGMRQIRLSPRP